MWRPATARGLRHWHADQARGQVHTLNVRLADLLRLGNMVDTGIQDGCSDLLHRTIRMVALQPVGARVCLFGQRSPFALTESRHRLRDVRCANGAKGAPQFGADAGRRSYCGGVPATDPLAFG